MGGAVSGFGAFSKRIPTVASGETGERDCANVGEVAEALALFEPQGAARDEACFRYGGQDPLDRHDVIAASCARRS